MKPLRRTLLCSIPAAIACSLLCNACGPIGKFKGRIKGKFMLTSPTAAELNLLSSAGSTQQAHDKGAFFKISNRSFDGDVQFNEFVWSDIEFENCDFVNCSMMSGVVRNVRFVNCLFFANAWQDKIWENVYFRDCAWHGPFKMGAATGNGLTQFEECEFIGATAEELGYGGKTEYFGSIGGTDGKVMYRKCKFERTFIYGGQVTECLSSRMSDVVIYGQDNSEILFDNILASNLVNLGNNHFSVVNVKSSTFSDRLTFEDTTIGSAVFENVIANLDLTIGQSSICSPRSCDIQRRRQSGDVFAVWTKLRVF